VALASRRGYVRVSPHIYNNSDDFERLAEVLKNPGEAR
jgi:selenocysteine lyase/cysteine desulfurase